MGLAVSNILHATLALNQLKARYAADLQEKGWFFL